MTEGYIIELFESAWLTQDMGVTDDWAKRGVWQDRSEVERVLARAMESIAAGMREEVSKP